MGGCLNLRELQENHSKRFYRQSWYADEPFMERHIHVPPRPPEFSSAMDPRGLSLPSAVALTWAFVLDPEHPVWDHWFWTADTDTEGQRVYVGRRNGLWEIHRHLAITSRWGVAVWA